MAETDRLCEACKLVDLYSLFTGPRSKDCGDLQSMPAVELGTLEEVVTNVRCPLCRLVRHNLYGVNDNTPFRRRQSDSLAGNGGLERAKARCTLRPVMATMSENLQFRKKATCDLVATTLIIELNATSHCSEEENQNISSNYIPNPARHIKLLSPDSVDPARPLLNGFVSTTLENSLKLLSKWLKTCHEHHASTCRGHDIPQQTLTTLSLIKTIEVSTRRLVEVNPRTTKYATLSWTWGQNQDAYLKLSDGLVAAYIDSDEGSIPSLSLPTHGVPLVTEDSISVCRSLNIPYLWVDVYCITQKDASKKKSGIGMMGLIYHLAYITFVAGGRSLLEHRSLSRNTDSTVEQQRIETIQGRRYISSCLSSVRDTVWNTRGWTYQEGQWTKRIAYFNQNELTFLCGAGQWRESMHSGVYGHESNIPGLDLSSGGLFIMTGYSWLRSSHWSFPDYAVIVQAYSNRILTYESDRLKAIEGCESHRCAQEPRLLSGLAISGLPLCTFVHPSR